MSHTIVSCTVKPGREQENAALLRGVPEELATAQPAGMRCAVLQSADSRELDEAADRDEHAATFKEFELIGAYRTFDDPEHLASAGETGDAQTDAGRRAHRWLCGCPESGSIRGASPDSSNTSKRTMMVEHDRRGLSVDPSASVAPVQIASCR